MFTLLPPIPILITLSKPKFHRQIHNFPFRHLLRPSQHGPKQIICLDLYLITRADIDNLLHQEVFHFIDLLVDIVILDRHEFFSCCNMSHLQVDLLFILFDLDSQLFCLFLSFLQILLYLLCLVADLVQHCFVVACYLPDEFVLLLILFLDCVELQVVGEGALGIQEWEDVFLQLVLDEADLVADFVFEDVDAPGVGQFKVLLVSLRLKLRSLLGLDIVLRRRIPVPLPSCRLLVPIR